MDNVILLPKQSVATIQEPPTAEAWTSILASAPAEELPRLREHAIRCLAGDVNNQRWSWYIGEVEQEMNRRDLLR